MRVAAAVQLGSMQACMRSAAAAHRARPLRQHRRVPAQLQELLAQAAHAYHGEAVARAIMRAAVVGDVHILTLQGPATPRERQHEDAC